MRRFQDKTPTPVAIFKHHTGPVTSVEWHPKDSAVFASAGSDNQIALWDLSVEKDDATDTDEIEVNRMMIILSDRQEFCVTLLNLLS